MTVESETKIEPTPKFKIESLDDLKRILIVAKGGDPDAIQAVANFMDLDSDTERSYFPDKLTTVCIGQLKGFGKLYYATDDWNPYDLVGDALSVSFMGFKGFKSNQFVDMTRQTPNLDALQTSTEEMKQGIIGRLLGRGKGE